MNKIIPLLCVFLGSNMAMAANCSDIKSCAMAVSDVTGQKYIFNSDIEKFKLSITPEAEITKENAELIFTAMLDQVGLARAPIGDGKTFRIVTGADRKEMEIPVVEASAEKAPSFSNTFDWVTMRYKPKSKELTDSIERAYRLHVPRNSRLQADYNAGIIIVTSSTPVVRQMYETIKAADVPQTAAVKKHLEEEKKRFAERRQNDAPRFTDGEGKK